MISKQRLSATVDADVMQAAEAAVREGRAANVSAWVNEAMRRHMEHDRRMQALDEFIARFTRRSPAKPATRGKKR